MTTKALKPNKVVAPGLVSPKRQVPTSIEFPPYAISGQPPPPSAPLVRTFEELEAMRKTGALAAEILLRAVAEVAPGVATDHIDAVVHEATISAGAYPSPLNYKGFPKSVCTSVNEVICHGIPDSRQLEEGDIVNIDVTTFRDGVHGDTSVTVFVGDRKGEVGFDGAVQNLVRQTYSAFKAGIGTVRPGGRVRDIGAAIEGHAKKHKLSVVRDFIGHGVGTEFHTNLAIPHYFDKRHDTEFGVGMTFTIEPMLNLGVADAEIWDDQWTAVTADKMPSAQFEHTLAVSDEDESGSEILTKTAAGECAHDFYE